MENQNQNTNNLQNEATPNVPTPPPASPQTPPQVAPIVSPPSPQGSKNKGLFLVAIVLAILIIILGVLYFVIIKQSYQSPSTTNTTPQVTVAPSPSLEPSVTPTDEQFLKTPGDNPASDSTQLNTDLNNL